MKKIFPLLMMSMLSFSAFSMQKNNQIKYKLYILQPGDTLSELLQKEGYHPLYGEGMWVEKILEANHLTPNTVTKIKKGLPIILPTDKDIRNAYKEKLVTRNIAPIYVDTVKTKKAATMQTGLLANSISKHQSYGVNFKYYSRSINLEEGNIQSQENFGVSFLYRDKKNLNMGSLSVNPTADLGIINHGSNYSDDIAINFRPTYYLQSSLLINAEDQMYYGPKLKLMSSSQAVNAEDEITVRRDNTAWLGVEAQKTYETRYTQYRFSAEIMTTAYASDNPDYKNLNGQRAALEGEVNLLNNYHLGIFSFREQYSGSSTKNIDGLGLNLKYVLE
tara:strand:+ start:54086 stop:55084 length:999 start_codon:yes stop_codon:yes gene_type:complete